MQNISQNRSTWISKLLYWGWSLVLKGSSNCSRRSILTVWMSQISIDSSRYSGKSIREPKWRSRSIQFQLRKCWVWSRPICKYEPRFSNKSTRPKRGNLNISVNWLPSMERVNCKGIFIEESYLLAMHDHSLIIQFMRWPCRVIRLRSCCRGSTGRPDSEWRACTSLIWPPFVRRGIVHFIGLCWAGSCQWCCRSRPFWLSFWWPWRTAPRPASWWKEGLLARSRRSCGTVQGSVQDGWSHTGSN